MECGAMEPLMSLARSEDIELEIQRFSILAIANLASCVENHSIMVEEGSLPLLVLHVSRIIDRHFAILHVLPMAVLTLGIVIAGVYGGGARDYIFIGYLVIGVAYLTFTYRPPEKPNPPMPQLT